MILSREDAEGKVQIYAVAEEIEITAVLGFGIDGWVFRSNRRSAIKVFATRQKYETERDVYLRLHEHGVKNVLGHAVPELLNSDNGLMIVEMTIVQPPYLLDFAQATLDAVPDFSSDAMEMWRAEKAEQFEHRWRDVQEVMSLLASRYGIHLIDINPGNITFGDEPD